MNTYTVVLSKSAKQEFDTAYNWLVEQTPQNAPAWYNGLLDALCSLEEYPLRCPLAHEKGAAKEETRVLVYGNKQHAYRILFSIRNNTVFIWHIRHAARRQS